MFPLNMNGGGSSVLCSHEGVAPFSLGEEGFTKPCLLSDTRYRLRYFKGSCPTPGGRSLRPKKNVSPCRHAIDNNRLWFFPCPSLRRNQVSSTVMTYEPFHCTFVGDTRGFKVTPEEGTLNRRGGDPQELDVSYKGNVST